MCEVCRARARAGDRAAPSPRSAFLRARKAEAQYVKLLRGVARQIGALCRGFDLEDAASHPALRAALDRYAHTLEPWAQSVGRRMVAEVAQRDASAWREVSALMGRNLRAEIATAPTGTVQRALQAEQVGLITSLPREAAERVHRLTQEGIVQGWRAERIAAEIMRTEQVARSRATLIAVTEVARAASNITQARAQHVGSTSYIWRTLDEDAREDHRILNGNVFQWSAPPVADRRTGARAHPGCIYRCRCWAEVILPE